MKFKGAKGWIEAAKTVAFDSRLGKEVVSYETTIAGHTIVVQSVHSPIGEQAAVDLLVDHVINSGYDLSETTAP